MTADLVAFLRTRLDEDEQLAREARAEVGRDWDLFDTGRGDGCVMEDRSTIIAWYDQHTGMDDLRIARPVAALMARFDPARVRAEVGAKRRIIDLHSPVRLHGGAGAKYFDTTTVCRSCEPPQFPDRAFPCPTLRLLALPFREHPDYQPDWAPGA
jgi:hypothetical protein